MVKLRRSQFKSLRLFLAYVGLFWMGLTFGVSLLAYLLAGDIYDYQDTVSQDQLPEVDAIVCLGGGRGRITAASDLWYRYWAQEQSVLAGKGLKFGEKLVVEGKLVQSQVPVLYFSGMGPQVSWPLLARQIKKEVSQKIRLENVVIERESSNTFANARWLVRYAQNHHWKKILLITSSYHMKRALYIFEHVLKNEESPIEIETLSVYQEPFDSQEWRKGPNGVRVTLIEYIKWVYYRSIWN